MGLHRLPADKVTVKFWLVSRPQISRRKGRKRERWRSPRKRKRRLNQPRKEQPVPLPVLAARLPQPEDVGEVAALTKLGEGVS